MIILRKNVLRQVAVSGVMVGALVAFAPQYDILGVSSAALATQNFGTGKYTPAPSKSEVVIDKNQSPVLSPQSI
jgi:hypothetical protein